MTTSWWDVPNADVVIFMGSNAAENHPISMKWYLRAKENGAKLISIDPRFTRTSSKCDIYLPMRSGTDIAILGGFVNYALTTGKFHKEYVVNYTNAALLLNPNFSFHEGLFSGWNESTKSYDQATWSFQLDEQGNPKRDDTLQDPNTVFQRMQQVYAGYTPEQVSAVSGIPVEKFKEVADIICSTGAAGLSAVFVYAMGWTQHTKGVQNIRCASVLQLLLGNIGTAGGGIAAHRGHANVQGATDLAVLYHDLPGYLGTPGRAHKDLATFLDKTTPKSGYWVNKPKFMVSLLKAWWGSAATKESDYAYAYLPKGKDPSYSHYDIFQAMLEDRVKGLFVIGQNPAVGSANAGKIPQAMPKLDWLVVTDLFMNETAEFWHMFGNDPSKVGTEVFLFPAAGPQEKEGSFTNSHRLLQWKHQAIRPLGESISDGAFINLLGKRIKQLYAGSAAAKDRPITDLVWGYDDPQDARSYDHLKVLKEINGYEVQSGKLVASFANLKDDGSTACGCWIYTGVYVEGADGKPVNKADARKGDPYVSYKQAQQNTPYLNLGWGFAWPANRRVLYNRASADPQGNPWSKRPLVWYDAAQGKWVGNDVPDMLAIKPGEVNAPTKVPFTTPFIMKEWGLGGLFGALKDGPFPVHYEPYESPTKNALHKQDKTPMAIIYKSQYDKVGTPADFPYVVTTYRLTEHQTSGVMTRNLPWLAEAFPHPFVEMSRELAAEKGIKSGDWVEVSSARGKVKVQAMVTPRLRPMKVNGQVVHEIGLPIHWAPIGLVTGDIVNNLTPQFVDVNVQIQESKAFLGNIRKVV
jgi:formate dehydrogenase-N alpha subunit